jgi:hypothetical protein
LNLDLLEERTLLSDVPVRPVFDLTDLTARDALATHPFPSDIFTVVDHTQNTGRVVNLPLPEDSTSSDYQDTQVINTLDGFNLQPRLSIPFSGPIDVHSVNSGDVFLVSMGDTLPHGDKGGEAVGINQIVWDPETNTLHVESDQLLDQHTRYALIVTNGVLDTAVPAQPVQASEVLTRFWHDLNFGQTHDPGLKEYRNELFDAMAAARQVGVPESNIVIASVFTTMSATATLEKIRDQIHEATPAPAEFNIGLNGEHTVFDLAQLTKITISQQAKVGQPPTATAFDPVSLLSIIPGAVGKVAFGMYRSPDYEEHPGEDIPAVGTRTGVPKALGTNDIYFTLTLPSGTEPADGWPVVITTHGGGGNKDGQFGVPMLAATMAANGISTIGINAVGHGYGPGGTVTVTQSDLTSVTLPAGGRGIDQNGDGTIGGAEGFSAAYPQEIISQRDGRIQTTADLMQLVRVIEAGVDVEGDGTADLDSSRIYYVSASLGSWYGAPFLAVEPDVTAGVLNTVGGPEVERRLGVSRSGDTKAVPVRTVGDILANRQPSLLNSPGIKSLDGLAVAAPYFNENMPLRDGVPLTAVWADGSTHVITSPWTNGGVDYVPGAMAIQTFLDNWAWVSQPGNPVAYAPYISKNPLPGVQAKSVIVQFTKGDETIVNPTTTAFLRAGELASRATYYRHDLARADNPARPENPHPFLGLITTPSMKAIALGAQQQIATFLASGGTDIIQPPGVPEAYFEVPLKGPLPEGLNYPGSAPAAAPALVPATRGSGAISSAALTKAWEPVAAPALLPSRMALSTSALVDLAIEALPPLGRLDSALDVNNLAVGLLTPTRRRR